MASTWPDADVAGGQQVGDAPGQHRRLAGPGAGDDQQRRALVQHGLALLRVEAVEEGFCVGVQIGHVQTHVRPNLPL